MEAQVTQKGMLDCQVCVPMDWTDKQVKKFADTNHLSGTENGWFVRKEGAAALAGDPERTPCHNKDGFVHIMLDC